MSSPQVVPPTPPQIVRVTEDETPFQPRAPGNPQHKEFQSGPSMTNIEGPPYPHDENRYHIDQPHVQTRHPPNERVVPYTFHHHENTSPPQEQSLGHRVRSHLPIYHKQYQMTERQMSVPTRIQALRNEEDENGSNMDSHMKAPKNPKKNKKSHLDVNFMNSPVNIDNEHDDMEIELSWEQKQEAATTMGWWKQKRRREKSDESVDSGVRPNIQAMKSLDDGGETIEDIELTIDHEDDDLTIGSKSSIRSGWSLGTRKLRLPASLRPSAKKDKEPSSQTPHKFDILSLTVQNGNSGNGDRGSEEGGAVEITLSDEFDTKADKKKKKKKIRSGREGAAAAIVAPYAIATTVSKEGKREKHSINDSVHGAFALKEGATGETVSSLSSEHSSAKDNLKTAASVETAETLESPTSITDVGGGMYIVDTGKSLADCLSDDGEESTVMAEKEKDSGGCCSGFCRNWKFLLCMFIPLMVALAGGYFFLSSLKGRGESGAASSVASGTSTEDNDAGIVDVVDVVSSAGDSDNDINIVFPTPVENSHDHATDFTTSAPTLEIKGDKDVYSEGEGENEVVGNIDGDADRSTIATVSAEQKNLGIVSTVNAGGTNDGRTVASSVSATRSSITTVDSNIKSMGASITAVGSISTKHTGTSSTTTKGDIIQTFQSSSVTTSSVFSVFSEGKVESIPTGPGGCYADDARCVDFYDALSQVTDPDALEQEDSPQQQAFHWILNVDVLETYPNDGDDREQDEKGEQRRRNLQKDGAKDDIGAHDIPVSALVQRYVMAVIYFALGGKHWLEEPEVDDFATDVRGNSWLSQSSECTWFGVKCFSGTTTVEGIDLGGRNLTGVLPYELSRLTSLQSLDLYLNKIQGIIPDGLFKSWQELLFLDLSWNQIDGKLPDDFYEMVSLKYLYLGNNHIGGNLSSNIAKLTSLIDFRIYGNIFDGLLPSEIGNLKNLRYFIARSNELEGELPTSFGDLSSLYYLDLSENLMSGKLPVELVKASKLRHLHLTNNNFSGEIPREYGELGDRQILTLHLNDNEFTGYLPYDFISFDKIAEIYLQNNDFEKVPDEICDLSIFYYGELVAYESDCYLCQCDEFCKLCA